MSAQHLALILIDIQRDFWQPLKILPRLSAFAANVTTLLQVARDKGLTIIHTQAWFKPDRSDWMLFYRPQGRGNVPCIADTDGALFEDFAMPLPHEIVIQKQTFDGFVGAPLESLLREHHVKAALIAGLETSVCVLFTATSAYLRRIVPLVVEDACGDELARHEATLRLYRELSFKTVTTAQVQREWDGVIQLVENFTEQ
jgi:nicotinamidase-related amidase